LVEDDAGARRAIQKVLTADGYDVVEAASRREASERLRAARPDAVVADCRLPDGTALDVLEEARRGAAEAPCGVVLADAGAFEVAVEALRRGADQFLVKPVDRPTLLLVLQRALDNRRARRRALREESLKPREPVDPFAGSAPAIRALAEKARRVLVGDRPVLIRGETGTGKGVLAAWLHANGPRRDEGFVDLNCAGLTRELLETELFGHEKGAFTGAVAAKPGLLEAADKGTLFLDEIGDVDLQVQPKLLKVLEEGRFRRLGEVRHRRTDVWLLAATHQNLSRAVEQKRFREDLYFRVSTILLELPPLRERLEDVPALAERFLARVAGELGRPAARLSAAALRRLQTHAWPGNIRELRNVLERAVLLTEAEILEPDDLGFDFDGARRDSRPSGGVVTLREAERQMIERALREERGHVARAAERLGISRSSLYQRIARHGIAVSRI
jgi:DNA-binding NtrC family response regulator